MLRLLGRANSSNVMKVMVLLDHLGLPYDRTDVGGAFGGTTTPEYRALNPNSIVPTLIEPGPDGDFVLWESNAILRYLAAAHAAGTPLWPDSLHARANIDRWMDWQQTILGPPMAVVFWGLVRTKPGDRDPAAIKAATVKLEAAYAILDRLLATHDYIAGPNLTPADISIGVHAHRWMSFDLPRPPQPNVDAWYRRLCDWPPYKKHVAVPMT